jgi:hypothetical protein
VTIKAVVNNGMRPGCCNIPHGWEYPAFIEGHYDDVLSLAHNPVCVNGAFSDALVQIEKVKEV